MDVIDGLAERFRPMKVGEVRGVRTADGREVLCHLISAPLLPHQIKAKPELAVRRAIQGARLAKELGATVKVESVKDKGSTFSVIIPAVVNSSGSGVEVIEKKADL